LSVLVTTHRIASLLGRAIGSLDPRHIFISDRQFNRLPPCCHDLRLPSCESEARVQAIMDHVNPAANDQFQGIDELGSEPTPGAGPGDPPKRVISSTRAGTCQRVFCPMLVPGMIPYAGRRCRSPAHAPTSPLGTHHVDLAKLGSWSAFDPISSRNRMFSK
jgi:hypothetical protein